MKKSQYIAPMLRCVRLGSENIMAVSGPETSETAAQQSNGMDVKANRYNGNSVKWDTWE